MIHAVAAAELIIGDRSTGKTRIAVRLEYNRRAAT